MGNVVCTWISEILFRTTCNTSHDSLRITGHASMQYLRSEINDSDLAARYLPFVSRCKHARKTLPRAEIRKVRKAAPCTVYNINAPLRHGYLRVIHLRRFLRSDYEPRAVVRSQTIDAFSALKSSTVVLQRALTSRRWFSTEEIV